MKVRDVERLLFDPAEKKKILLFRVYMAQRGFPRAVRDPLKKTRVFGRAAV